MWMALLVLTSGAVSADTDRLCADRGQVVTMLSEHYGETVLGGGLHSDNSIVELWLSERQQTWTILLTTSSGQSCVIAVGTDWDMVPSLQYPVAGLPG